MLRFGYISLQRSTLSSRRLVTTLQFVRRSSSASGESCDIHSPQLTNESKKLLDQLRAGDRWALARAITLGKVDPHKINNHY